MSEAPQLLARGPWSPDQVHARWHEEPWTATPDAERLADAAVAELRERGSPSHDGLAARLAHWSAEPGRLELELQPARWALRLVDGAGGSSSLTALCVVRTADGRWLAGLRAGWLSTWANRWALGAGGAVDLGESPADTLARELHEEWQLEPLALSVEALIGLPTGMKMVVGVATVSDDVEPVMDAEHVEFAWWPADVARWPAEAGERVRRMGAFLGGA